MRDIFWAQLTKIDFLYNIEKDLIIKAIGPLVLFSPRTFPEHPVPPIAGLE